MPAHPLLLLRQWHRDDARYSVPIVG
jgi:hypothetical protein